MKDIQDILRDQKIIHFDTEITSGAPVFVGTRILLQTFFDYLEGEFGLAEFLEDFPHLKAQVLQVLETATFSPKRRYGRTFTTGINSSI